MSIALTVSDIRRLCANNKYIGLRDGSGYLMGINCRVPFMGKNKNNDEKRKTEFISYKVLSLNEYISIKHPFY